jgi:IMP dehydrogenase
MMGGITSGFSYCGAPDIKTLRENAAFVKVTPNGLRENGFHDVHHAQSN